jgi:hypothetical protein
MVRPRAEDRPALPAVVPLWPDCGSLLGLGRSATFDAAKRGELPWPVWRIGGRLVCPRALVRAALGLDEPDHADGGGPTASRRRHRVEEPSTTRRAARKAGGADGSA